MHYNRSPTIQILSDLDFDLSRSLKSDITAVLSIYDFVLVFISKIWPNGTTLPYIRLRNVSNLDSDFSRSLKVINDGANAHILFPITVQ